jgi:hypothetical protein
MSGPPSADAALHGETARRAASSFVVLRRTPEEKESVVARQRTFGRPWSTAVRGRLGISAK